MTTHAAPQQTGLLHDWLIHRGPAWIYLLKALLAAFLSLYLSMRLQLSLPKTAMTTVFIVMQPQSGAVLSKSFYRLFGTIIGLFVTLLLVALFAQQRVLFLTALACWIALCTVGAARNRNFKSYGFLLSGYTAALIGLPAAQAPDGAFMLAMTRVSEIIIGIFSAGIVSALIFPQYSGAQMRDTIRLRFNKFMLFVTRNLSGAATPEYFFDTHHQFLTDIIGFEKNRSFVLFERHHERHKNGRLNRLNSEFMAATSRFHAMINLEARLKRDGSIHVIKIISHYWHELAQLLQPALCQPSKQVEAAQQIAQNLARYQQQLSQRMREEQPVPSPLTQNQQLELQTALELFSLFLTELQAYCATYHSLTAQRHERERWVERYTPHTNTFAAYIAGSRVLLVVLITSLLWITTDWPSGVLLVFNASAIAALSSTLPNSTIATYHMAMGALLACLLGGILLFLIYPLINGFLLLCVALTPFLALGVYLMLQPRWAAYGIGYAIFISTLAGPDNIMHYNLGDYINQSIALVCSMFIAVLAFAIYFPTNGDWLKKLLLSDLLRQVSLTVKRPLKGLRPKFESTTRDLVYQLQQQPHLTQQERHQLLNSMFVVLEIGNAILDLRNTLQHYQASFRTNSDFEQAWLSAVSTTLHNLMLLFKTDSRTTVSHTLQQLEQAIEILTSEDRSSKTNSFSEAVLRQLHFIRASLFDSAVFLEKSSPISDKHGASVC